MSDENQARGPVSVLSGGEKARLLLSRIMARESNLLVMDEPTNDLDVETLDLLQEILDGYDGTVLLVSHDRDFLDRVATTTLAFEGNGKVVAYAGGWSDYQTQKKSQNAEIRHSKNSKKKSKKHHGDCNKKLRVSFKIPRCSIFCFDCNFFTFRNYLPRNCFLPRPYFG